MIENLVKIPFSVTDLFWDKAAFWADGNYKYVCLFHSNNYKQDKYSQYEMVLAVSNNTSKCYKGGVIGLDSYFKNCKQTAFGFLTYDLKNEIEDLKSNNDDGVEIPDAFFFEPDVLLVQKNGELFVSDKSIINEIQAQEHEVEVSYDKVELERKINREEYLNSVNRIKKNIEEGEVYEMNFCMEFFSDKSQINPPQVFNKLNARAKAPFSCFFKVDKKYALCASPERFLQRQGNKLISQPIKGTIRRGKDELDDSFLKNQLFFDPKERSENVMIVDLVRNDFNRVCEPGSVKVSELYGIYTYETVHQMISTVEGELTDELGLKEILQAVFPMGSMTGAPKIAAMQKIEAYEKTKRALYSGSIGYVNPKGDFDFNVVIRSIVYNATKPFISIQIGSAITIDSIAEKEYEECLLKAEAMIKALGG